MTDTTYDLTEVVQGNVDSITEKLPELTDGDLPTLSSLEARGQNRSTLIEAIDHERKRREEQAVADTEGHFTQADIDAAVAAREAELNKKHKAAIETLTSDHAKELAAKKPVKAASPGKAKREKPLAIDAKADGPALTALTGASTIRFADGDNVPIADLQPMAFGIPDYRPIGDRVVLERDVEFPVALAATQVLSAFLVDGDGRMSGKAELVMPFDIGGGRQAKLPGGTLCFFGAAATRAKAMPA